MIQRESVTVTTTGTAGVATGTGTSKAIRGKILALALNFHASAPATTDVTVRCTFPFNYDIVVVTNSATDVYLTPRAKPVDNANVAITNAFDFFIADSSVEVVVAQSDALTGAVVVTIWYDRSQV